MTQSFEEYLEYIAKHGDGFATKKVKLDTKDVKIKLIGSNGNFIYLKDDIYLNYRNSESIDTIYIEDISNNKQFTRDLNHKAFKLHLSDNILYIDFNTDYYYALVEFDTFEQYKYCQKNKQLTIALLNNDKSDIINKWTTNVNLL